MIMRLLWQEYGQAEDPSTHSFEAATEDEIRTALAMVRTRAAEEVLVQPAPGEGREPDRELTFQLDPEQRYAYLCYAQADVGLLQSVGDPVSPGQFTTSGGSFSPGTGIPAADLEEVVLEFFRSGEKPAAVSWEEDA